MDPLIVSDPAIHDGQTDYCRYAHHRRTHSREVGERGNFRTTSGFTPPFDQASDSGSAEFCRASASRRCLVPHPQSICMNLLANEGVERPIVERLRRDGHDVVYVSELCSEHYR